jgi:DNA polymerase I
LLKPLQLKRPLNIRRIRYNISDLDDLRYWLDGVGVFALDIETNLVSEFFTRKIRTVQLGNNDIQYVIDLLDFESDLVAYQGNYGKSLHLSPNLQGLVNVLKSYLELQSKIKVGANLAFEYEAFLWNFGIRSCGFFDVNLVERVIYAGEHSLKDYPFFALGTLVERYYGMTPDKTLQTSFDLSTALTDAQVEYCALDTVLPLAIRRKQLEIIKRDGLEEVCQIENDCIMPFIDMHLNGIRIDKEKWVARIEQNKKDLKLAIAELDKYFIRHVGRKDKEPITEESLAGMEKMWRDAVGDERKANRSKFYAFRRARKEYLDSLADCEGQAHINYGSPEQVLAVLNRMEGLKKLKDTNDDSIKNIDLPVIRALQKYRKLSKLIETYGEAWVQEWKIKPGGDVSKGEGWLWLDGKLHCKFHQMDTETGRSSSSNPNGQNLPKDPEVRACFVSDSEDEVLITADMSGAELRIIAELANAKSWIDAFNRGEDVHSVGCEILFPDRWPALALPDCEYYVNKGKCKCPEHKKLRDANKSTNFLLAYGGTETKLSNELGSTKEYAKELMDLHSKKFPDIWRYLSESGKRAFFTKEARDLFGRRRKFPHPTRERAELKVKEDREDNLRYPPDVAERTIKSFTDRYGRGPLGKIKELNSEMWNCTHRPVSDKEIINKQISLGYSVERAGKNHCIQGSNATIIKLAMSAAVDKDGKPYLWRILPKYRARLLLMVHDELVVSVPKEHAETVAREVGDAFRRAAATHMTKVTMEFEYKIKPCWAK